MQPSRETVEEGLIVVECSRVGLVYAAESHETADLGLIGGGDHDVLREALQSGSGIASGYSQMTFEGILIGVVAGASI